MDLGRRHALTTFLIHLDNFRRTLPPWSAFEAPVSAECLPIAASALVSAKVCVGVMATASVMCSVFRPPLASRQLSFSRRRRDLESFLFSFDNLVFKNLRFFALPLSETKVSLSLGAGGV